MKRLALLFAAALVAAMPDLNAAQSDSAYTGTANGPADTAPAKKTKKKAAKSADSAKPKSEAESSAVTQQTNSVSKPAGPSPSAVTNVPTETGPSTKSMEKPSAPAASANTAAATEPSTNSVMRPSSPPATTNAPPVTATEPPVPPISVATLTTADLKEYGAAPPRIQALITHGLELTSMDLKYQYGSADPTKGGMDCSGTVYYLLKQAGIKDVPRDASELYTWVWKKEHVTPVTSSNLDTFELSKLKPGDLLFWTGTYDIQRDPPITHVMIYLGTNKETGNRVMVGASEGRAYAGKPRYGVSVFDFVLPQASGKSDSSRFIGYGPVPDL